MAGLPAWVGWPGTGPAPGHDWMPGPALRSAILLLTYAFLALALTVNYAASVTFFLLALIGVYVGLRRGFVNGLTRTEKLLMLAFAAYPAAVIIAFLLGEHTNVGFRMVGRNLRFLLFVPVFLALRWAGVRPINIALGLAAGVTGGVLVASCHWIAETPNALAGIGAPHGVASTHVIFGDLGILFGLMVPSVIANDRSSLARTLSLYGLVAGSTLAILSMARGAWLVLPIAGALLVWESRGLRARRAISIGLAVVVLGGAASAFLFHSTIAGRAVGTAKALERATRSLRWKSDMHECPNTSVFLRHYVDGIHSPRGTAQGAILLKTGVALPLPWAEICEGTAAIQLRGATRDGGPAFFILPRMGFVGQAQHFALLAKGRGSLFLWWQRSSASIDERSFQLRSAASRSKEPGVPAVVAVNSNESVTFVPLQQPRLLDGYSLVLGRGSVLARLRMWRFAWTRFLKRPLLGYGVGAFRMISEIASLHGDGDAIVARAYEHPHSIYLNNLFSGGVVLGIALLALLAAPALGGWYNYGFVLTLSLLLVGMTESVFVHSLFVSAYVVLVSVITVARPLAKTRRGIASAS